MIKQKKRNEKKKRSKGKRYNTKNERQKKSEIGTNIFILINYTMYAEKIKMNKSLIKQNSYNLLERGNRE